MKRIVTGLMTLCLLLCLLPAPAMAADEGRSYLFDLTAGGESEIHAQPGEVLTVSLMLRRTDAAPEDTMYAMQDEISYDDSFFELVPGSLLTGPGIEHRDLALQSGGRALYLNYLSLGSGATWDRDALVGSFQVKVLGTKGASRLENRNCRVSNADGSDSFLTEAQDLTVVVSSECTVHFETNGGSALEDLTIPFGETIPQPADPVREGFTLEGWYKDVNCTDKWDFASDTVQGNMTLYAHWTQGTAPVPGEGPDTMDPLHLGLLLAVLAVLIVLFLILFLKKKTVCFLLNADTEYLRVQVKRGGKLLRPADPTREGFRFGGWFRDAACTQPWNFDSDTVTSGLQLYARWEGDAQ